MALLLTLLASLVRWFIYFVYSDIVYTQPAERAAEQAEKAMVEAVRMAQINGARALGDLLEELKHLRAAMEIIAGAEV